MNFKSKYNKDLFRAILAAALYAMFALKWEDSV
jgi:hypothetical protein